MKVIELRNISEGQRLSERAIEQSKLLDGYIGIGAKESKLEPVERGEELRLVLGRVVTHDALGERSVLAHALHGLPAHPLNLAPTGSFLGNDVSRPDAE